METMTALTTIFVTCQMEIVSREVPRANAMKCVRQEPGVLIG